MSHPAKIYKYLSQDRIDVLTSGHVRFTFPDDLNDPCECKPFLTELFPHEMVLENFFDTAFKILEEELEKIPEDFRPQIRELCKANIIGNAATHQRNVLHAMDALTPAMQSVLWRKTNELVGIFSTTETPDHHLMWAHYANSHQGFVIEFDPTSPFFDQRKSPEDQFRHLQKVIYNSTKTPITLMDINDATPFLSKSHEWIYEQEWRIICCLADADKVIDNNGTKIHLFSYPKTMVKSIIFGCKMSKKAKAAIIGILKTDKEFQNVALYQAKLDPTSYSISITNY